jgi:hypothetical protein
MASITFADAWTGWYEEKSPSEPVPSKEAAQERTVVALAWMDQSVVEEGKRFRLWVSLENRSDSAAVGLHFTSFQIPGFHAVSCWAAGGPACIPRGAGERPVLGLPLRLEKGQSATVFAVLEPLSKHGQFGASGVFTWRDERRVEQKGAVVAPVITVTSREEHLWFSLGKMVSLLKDLLVPAAIAYLGWYLQNRDKERERKEDAAKQQKETDEREHDLDREERERKQTRLRETWNLMLPKSHANAEQHYMPVVAAIDGLLFEARRTWLDSRDEHWHMLLWALLRVLRRMQDLAQAIGGFYFRDLAGEKLARMCWNEFYFRSRNQLGPADRDRAVSAIERNENLASFLDRLSGHPAETSPGAWVIAVLDPKAGEETAQTLGRLDTCMRGWLTLGGLQLSLPLLELLEVIVKYEMNRTYELWYGTQAHFDEETFWIALHRLEPKLKPIYEEAVAYSESIKKRVEEGTK